MEPAKHQRVSTEVQPGSFSGRRWFWWREPDGAWTQRWHTFFRSCQLARREDDSARDSAASSAQPVLREEDRRVSPAKRKRDTSPH